MDAVRYLLALPPGSVDLIVTDPAYESLEKHRARGTTTRLKQSTASSNPWFPIFPNERFREFFDACWQALRPNAHLYVYCDDETAYLLKPIGEQVGFHYWKRIVWDKMKIGLGYHYRSRVEYILFFEKGKRRLNDLAMPDAFDFKEDPDGYALECTRIARGYPTEKPVMCSERLICQSSDPGELVVDPFMGSGSVGEAALRNRRRFAGCDILDEAVQRATHRLATVAAELDLLNTNDICDVESQGTAALPLHPAP